MKRFTTEKRKSIFDIQQISFTRKFYLNLNHIMAKLTSVTFPHCMPFFLCFTVFFLFPFRWSPSKTRPSPKFTTSFPKLLPRPSSLETHKNTHTRSPFSLSSDFSYRLLPFSVSTSAMAALESLLLGRAPFEDTKNTTRRVKTLLKTKRTPPSSKKPFR